jgi:alkanesulfonate monooxygenase SsuD/methylene tetrahydromethanopterin reductase-like flavin-dependent oxidoreductase (luciferase family)
MIGVNDVEIGVFVNPNAAALPRLVEAVRVAEATGFDYVSVQDHPYVPDHLDTFSLIAWLAGRTERLRLGASGPRMLAILGSIADGWIAPLATPFESKPAAQRAIDSAAIAAGRDPSVIRRVMQLVGTVVKDAPPRARPTHGDGRTPIRATPGDWAEIIAGFLTQERFDTVNLVLEQATAKQVAMFGELVLPEVRARLASAPA